MNINKISQNISISIYFIDEKYVNN